MIILLKIVKNNRCNFSFIKTSMKGIILFLFKETSALSRLLWEHHEPRDLIHSEAQTTFSTQDLSVAVAGLVPSLLGTAVRLS